MGSARRLFVGGGDSVAGLVAAEVAEFKGTDTLGRCVVVVPNAATGERIRAALGTGGALLNVEVLTVEKAAGVVLGGAAGSAPGLQLPAGAERLLVRRLLSGGGPGAVYEKLVGSAGFLGSLAGNMRDVMDAGLGGAGLKDPGGARSGLRDLLGLARAYENLRGQLGVEDDTSRFAKAIGLLEAGQSRLGECVIMVGVYDPTGLQEAFLLEALMTADRARVFLAGHGFGTGFRERLGTALGSSWEQLEVEAKGASQLEWLRGVWDSDLAGTAPLVDGSVQVLSSPGGAVGAELIAREVAAALDADEALLPSEVELVSRGTGGIPPGPVVRELVRLGVPVLRGAGTLGETHVGRSLLGLVEVLAAPRVSRGRLMDLVDDLPWRLDGVDLGGGELRVVDPGERALWDRFGRGADLRVVINMESSSVESGRLVLARARADEKDAARGFVAWVEGLAKLHRAVRDGAESDTGWARFGVRLAQWMAAWMRPDAAGFAEWRARLLGLGRFDQGAGALDGAGFGWVMGGFGREGFVGPNVDPGGVRVSRLGQRRGAQAKLVILLDGDEGSFPLAPAANVLLGDRDRVLLGKRAPSLLNGTAERREGEERALFGELLALAGQRLLMVTTRAGIEGRGATPSRLVLEAMGILAGDGLRLAPASADVAEGNVDKVPGLGRLELAGAWRRQAGADPVGAREQLLWAVDSALMGGADGVQVRAALGAAKAVHAGGLAAEVERLAKLGQSAYDGQLGGEVLSRLLGAHTFRGSPEKGISPSRLETFAGCGMRAFLQSVLGLREHDLPEESRGILAADRGKRVHEILEIFGRNAEVFGAWADAQFEDLRGVLFKSITKVVGKAKQAAPDDQAALWDAEALRYRGLLLGWLRAELRRGGDWRAAEFEWDFEHARFELREPLDDEDTAAPLYMRGRADRIDTRQVGGEGGALEVRVVDYKTGKGGNVGDDRTGAGQHLQLALYGAAARAKMGASASEGVYDFVFFGKQNRWTGRGLLKSSRSRKAAQTDDTARREVRALVESMEAGVFWPSPRAEGRPAKDGCRFCGMQEACGPWREDGFVAAGEADPVVVALAEALVVEGEEA